MRVLNIWQASMRMIQFLWVEKKLSASCWWIRVDFFLWKKSVRMKWGLIDYRDYQQCNLGNAVGSWAAHRCHTIGGLQSQCNFTGCVHGVESDKIKSRNVWCQRSRRWFPSQVQDCLIKCNGICKCAHWAWQTVKRNEKSKHLRLRNAPLPEQHFLR